MDELLGYIVGGIEVDFILGDMQIAIEAKSSTRVTQDHLKGLQSRSTDRGEPGVAGAEDGGRNRDPSGCVAPALGGGTRELERAFGLGGRERRAGAAAERARVSVTRAIKYATKKIERHDPALADHIARNVRTGTFCVYAPSDRDRVDWRR